MKTAVSSGSPCGKMKRKKCQGPAYTYTIAPAIPTPVALPHRILSGYTPVIPVTTAWRAIHALFAHTDKPNSALVSWW